MELPQRKTIRVPEFDYGQDGAYFITVCTHKRRKLFGKVGENSAAAQIVQQSFLEALDTFPYASCPKYVVMPDHFHAIILIENGEIPLRTSLEQIVQSFKSRSTVAFVHAVKAGAVPPFQEKIWQRSFYDHIIRNQQDYLEIWQYIENNPLKWRLDRSCAQD